MIRRRRMLCFVLATLEIFTWNSISVSSWPFLSRHNVPQQEHYVHFLDETAQIPPDSQGLKSEAYGSEEAYRGLSRVGSRPPSCEHKCEGCLPCNAIQTPATTDRKSLQFANYEPEGWKCKCGTAFYNP